MARIDGIIILDSNGKPLITSNFAPRPPSYAAFHVDAFNHALAKARAEKPDPAHGTSSNTATSTPGEVDPVLWVNTLARNGSGGMGASGAVLCHLERDGLRYLVPISEDVNPLLAFTFLESFLETLGEYLGAVTEAHVKDNFEIVYMLIEEMLDEGHPMTMETNMLKEIVLPPSLMRKLLNVAGVSGLQSNPTAPYVAPIPWRRQGVRHQNNEIYFDVIETLDAIVDRRGKLLQSDVWGRITCNSRLSGNPDLVLSFKDSKKILQDCAFHPCIRNNRWERDGVLSFIPPDGKFKLLEYMAPSATVPFLLKASVSLDETGGKFALTLQSRLTTAPIEDIVVSFFLGDTATSISATPAGDRRPQYTPSALDAVSGGAGGIQTSKPEGRVGGGSVDFDPNSHILRWRLSSLVSHERSPSLTGSFVSSSRPNPDPAVTVSYSVTNYLYSGLKVDSLKVLGEGYKVFKGVRTRATSGRVEVRW